MGHITGIEKTCSQPFEGAVPYTAMIRSFMVAFVAAADAWRTPGQHSHRGA